MPESSKIWFIGAGIFAIILAAVSAWRVVTRLMDGRLLSAAGFGLRLAISLYIGYAFFRIA